VHAEPANAIPLLSGAWLLASVLASAVVGTRWQLLSWDVPTVSRRGRLEVAEG
jgi:hypothetical protein